MAVIEKIIKQRPENKGQAMVETLFSMMLMIGLILGVFQVGLIGSGKMLTIVGAHRAARANQLKVLDEYDTYSWSGGFGLGSADAIPNMFDHHQGLKAGSGFGFGGPDFEESTTGPEDQLNMVEVEVGQNYLLKSIPFFDTGSSFGGWFSDINLITGGMNSSGLGFGWTAPVQQHGYAEMPRVWENSLDYDADSPY